MELKGKVLQLLPLQTGVGKKGNWKKQEFILETQAQYPKKVCLSIWGDKECPPVGSLVTASVELESREYNSKWYTEARAWKVEITEIGIGQSKIDPKKEEQETGFIANNADEDNLPF